MSKFLSTFTLIQLLENATNDERLALTKILDDSEKTAFNPVKLQNEISSVGRHSFVSFFRGEGTGYLDILDDVADELKIRDRKSYNNVVKYYDEVYYIIREKDDTLNSTTTRLYTKNEALKHAETYSDAIENKIILELFKLTYQSMLDSKEKLSDEIGKAKEIKTIIEKEINVLENSIKQSKDEILLNQEVKGVG